MKAVLKFQEEKKNPDAVEARDTKQVKLQDVCISIMLLVGNEGYL